MISDLTCAPVTGACTSASLWLPYIESMTDRFGSLIEAHTPAA